MARGASVAADGGTRTSASRRRGTGWTHDERIAFVEAYGQVSFDFAVGDQQQRDTSLERIEGRFLAHSRCISQEDWDHYPDKDKSSWYRRCAQSCKNHADAIC